jgi:hypothetical protein
LTLHQTGATSLMPLLRLSTFETKWV